MSRKITFVGLLLFYSQLSIAQYCNDGQPASSAFDWTASSWQVLIRPIFTQIPVLVTVPSPYYPANITSQPNTQHIEAASGMGDCHPDDGWVLAAELMGFDEPVRFPQFVIYNRYEAKLRYFAYVTDLTIGEVQVQARFSGGNGFTHVSAALEHAFTPMDVVEGYTDKKIIISTPNEFFSQSGIWVMADIPIAYDPCTCQYSSQIRLGTESVDYVNINFTLEGGGAITQVIENGAVVNKGNRFANTLGGVANGVSKGTSAYKSAAVIGSVAGGILRSSANKKLTPEIVSTLAGAGVTVPPTGLTTQNVNFLYQLSNAGNASPPVDAAIKTLFPKSVPNSLVPDWFKTIVPFANTAFPLLDFIVGGGKSTPPQPMHFQADFEFIGTGFLDDPDPQARIDFDFRVPGSKAVQGGPDIRNPVYDEVMGVLNLVEKPVLYRASQQTTIWEGDNPGLDPFYNNFNEYSLKLAQPLRYALNPAAGLELSDIRASLQFRRCQFSNDYGNPSFDYFDIPEGLIDAGGGIWQTPYLPLSCLEHYSLKFLVTEAHPTVPGISDYDQCEETYLHLTAKLKPPGSVNETAFSALYHVDFQTAPYTFAQTPANPYLHIPNDLTVDRLEDVINGNLFSWNEITISQDATVTQQINNFLSDKEPRGLIFVPGDPAAGTSGYVILEEIKEREIGTTIHAPFTVTNLPNCGDNDPVDAAWLAGFCADQSRYNPVLLIADDDPYVEEELPSYMRTPELPALAAPARLLPNPAHDWAWLEYELPEDGYVSILVTDYLGRQALAVLQQGWQAAGAYRQAIPLGRLSPGWYYVSLVQAEGAQTLKLMKE